MKMNEPIVSKNGVSVHHGDCKEVMRGMEEESVHAIVTDPPYGLEFMGKEWDRISEANGFRRRQNTNDTGRDSVFGRTSCCAPEYAAGKSMQQWHYDWAIEALRVLKPGGHLLAFGGSRTFHRLTCALEDAGFEIRDCIMWLYGSGFPKSLDVSKAIDKEAGVKRDVVGTSNRGSGAQPHKLNAHSKGDTGIGYMDGSGKIFELTTPSTDAAKKWNGYGTALKPAFEPIIVARKPLDGTVAKNVQKHGTGAINVDGCRVAHVTVDGGCLALNPHLRTHINGGNGGHVITTEDETRVVTPHAAGRWPANLIHDGSEEVVNLFPQTSSGTLVGKYSGGGGEGIYSAFGVADKHFEANSGSAARFFYCAKASKAERNGSKHPTVKPVDLMRYLVRLVSPPEGGIVLDPFAGSGTTAEACVHERVHCIAIEREAEYVSDIQKRLSKSVFSQKNMF